MEHYSEDSGPYKSAITSLNDLRKLVSNPSRDDTGVRSLIDYFNQLYFVEKRFVPTDRNFSLFFQWWAIFSKFAIVKEYMRIRYDTFTGTTGYAEVNCVWESQCSFQCCCCLYANLLLNKYVDIVSRSSLSFDFLNCLTINVPSKSALSPTSPIDIFNKVSAASLQWSNFCRIERQSKVLTSRTNVCVVPLVLCDIFAKIFPTLLAWTCDGTRLICWRSWFS